MNFSEVKGDLCGRANYLNSELLKITEQSRTSY